MILRLSRQLINTLKRVENNIVKMLGYPPPEIALAYVHEKQPTTSSKCFSLKDIVGDGFLLAVPKYRRTIEKRWKRKFGALNYVWKMHTPKTNLVVCNDCGHYQERGRLCGNCYQKVIAETEKIQNKIKETLGINKPIENDVIVLYQGESVPDKSQEFWQGKRIVEMNTERPLFCKNLLQKSTQEPSTSTDVKPSDLA